MMVNKLVDGVGGEQRPVAKKRFVPVGDYVAIHAIRDKETPGGLQLPDGSVGSVTTPRGRVVAVGPDVKQVKEGDLMLIIGTTTVGKIWFMGDEYLIIREKEIPGGVVLPEFGGRMPG